MFKVGVQKQTSRRVRGVRLAAAVSFSKVTMRLKVERTDFRRTGGLVLLFAFQIAFRNANFNVASRALHFTLRVYFLFSNTFPSRIPHT